MKPNNSVVRKYVHESVLDGDLDTRLCAVDFADRPRETTTVADMIHENVKNELRLKYGGVIGESRTAKKES